MANIRVTCPACKSELELDAAFEGQEVECGNCLEVFKAKGPGSSGSGRAGKIPGTGPRASAGTSGSGGRSSPARRPAPKKRRRDDDDDDYEHDRRRRDEDDEDDYAPPPARRTAAAGAGDGVATASLVLGILSIVVCCCYPISLPLGLAAAITGGLGMKSENNKGMAVAGMVMGIIAMCMSGVFIAAGFGNAPINRFN